VCPGKLVCTGAEGFVIERSRHMPGAAELKRRKHGCGREPITINLSAGQEAGVKSGRDEGTTNDANLRGKGCVEGRYQNCGRESGRRKINMGALPEGMHSSVGAAGAVNADFLANDLEKGGLDLVLDRVATRLALPARKPSTIIGDDQFQASAATGYRRPILVRQSAQGCPG
jgi:hypothetical protein